MDERTIAESVATLWAKACKHDGIDPTSKFVVWSDSNPYAASYNDAMGRLLELRGQRAGTLYRLRYEIHSDMDDEIVAEGRVEVRAKSLRLAKIEARKQLYDSHPAADERIHPMISVYEDDPEDSDNQDERLDAELREAEGL